jgi:hypothetical protein
LWPTQRRRKEESEGKIITIAFCGFVVSQKASERHKKQIRGESEKFFYNAEKETHVAGGGEGKVSLVSGGRRNRGMISMFTETFG